MKRDSFQYPTVENALRQLCPNAAWAVTYGTTDDDYSIDWQSDLQQPTKKQINAEIKKLQEAFDLNEYAFDREKKYPPIGDQLDALYHAGVFPEEMTAQIKAVKDLYPKPIEGGVE